MKTRKRKKPKTYWAWKDKDGVIATNICRSRKDAKNFTPWDYWCGDWQTAYADGWRIVKVKIVEARK